MLAKMAIKNMVDMFIGFHGPGNLSHPYFNCPFERLLSYEKQKLNRAKFFEILNAKELDDKERLSQSMTQIHYNPRPVDLSGSGDKWQYDVSRSWVTMNTTDHNIAMTIEVNMNTPLSTNEGYRSEAVVLGRAISKYFANDHHQR